MKLVQKRGWFYGFSLLLIIPGVLALLFWHLRFGIDFAGGAVAELGWQTSPVSVDDLKQAALQTKTPGLQVQSSGPTTLLLRFASTSQDEAKSKLTAIEDVLRPKVSNLTENSFAVVGPTVSQSTTNRAIRAVIIASIVIVLYIAYAFRGVKKPASPWLFGLAAIVALLHDLLVTAGLFAILGHFLLWIEVDSLFVVALLTVLGFSVHDTIVVFDRVRENLRLYPKEPFEAVVNMSLTQTLGRSLKTSLTVLLTLLALLLFGSTSTRSFIVALLLGVLTGTYSSIFNASMLLVSWKQLGDRRRRRTA